MFQAAKSTDTGLREIMLSDERTEKKWSIRLFLDLLYGVEIPPPEIGYRKYVNVTDLLDKYDCKAAKTAWKWAIGNWVRDEQSSELAVFLVAASARLWEQCRLVLQATTRTWRSDNWQLNGRMSIEQTLRISLNEQQDDKRPLLKTETDDIGDIECWASDTEEDSVFDLGTWPREFTDYIDPFVFFALLRAQREVCPTGIFQPADREGIACLWLRYMCESASDFRGKENLTIRGAG